MELVEFEDLLVTGVAASKVITAYIQCEVTYSGRAETFLARGDRILIVKTDKTVLLHQPEGATPVNYMKAGTVIGVEKEKKRLLLKLYNQKEKAWLDIEVFRVYDAMSHRLADGQKIDLAGNERDMSDWIRDNPRSISKSFRPIAREEQTDVGFIDVFGHDAKGGLVVVECKRVTASLQAVDQLRRYVERVKKIRGTDDVKGFLAAPAITPNALEMLQSWGFIFAQVEPPKRLEKWQQDQKSLGEF